MDSLEREWWLRALLVLQAPRAVFAALRDDSIEAAQARQEPITALIFLAAIAAVLSSPPFGRLLDDPEIDGLLVPVLAVAAGGIYGFFGYWIGGGLVYLGARGAGGDGTYRRARHILGFAAAPLALSLLAVWPLRLALYGGDVFRTGGADAGAAADVFAGLELAFIVWALALLPIGVRVVHRWSWFRSLAACGLAAALPALAVLVDLLG